MGKIGLALLFIAIAVFMFMVGIVVSAVLFKRKFGKILTLGKYTDEEIDKAVSYINKNYKKED